MWMRNPKQNKKAPSYLTHLHQPLPPPHNPLQPPPTIPTIPPNPLPHLPLPLNHAPHPLTFVRLIPQPILIRRLNNLHLNAIHHAQRNEQIVPVRAEALARAVEAAGGV